MVDKEAAAPVRPRGAASVVAALAACLALAVLVDPALGLGALALLLAAGGLVRLLLPHRWVPGLVVRSRVVDAVTLLVLAVVLALLTATTPSL